MTMLLWVDLETAGLGNHTPVLEIAAVATSADASAEVAFTYGAVLAPPTGWETLMGDYVRTMHTGNGLLADVASATVTLREAEAALCALMDGRGVGDRWTLAGRGVSHFDKGVIDAQMPTLAKRLRYRCLDVSTLGMAVEMAGRADLFAAGSTYEGDAFADKPHRAMADVLDHLAEWRAYAGAFASLPKADA